MTPLGPDPDDGEMRKEEEGLNELAILALGSIKTLNGQILIYFKPWQSGMAINSTFKSLKAR